MEKLFCPYCGELLEERCDCLRELAERKQQLIDDYENSPETQYGWAQEDLIYNHRMER